MTTYLLNHQQTDGGWGTHIECASTMFGTVMSYVALRLLGSSPDAAYMKRARKFIHKWGGALYAPSWAKFWLAVIGVYDWKGINSIPAEMWLLPRWLPFHPGKLWCHCRMVYLPMCYVYCTRFTPDVSTDPVLQGLRRELYLPDDGEYESIDWNYHRQTCAPIDEYSALKPVMKVAQDFLSYYEWFLERSEILQRVRRYALSFVIEYIHAEDEQTNYVDIGPVNKALNMVCVWLDGGRDGKNSCFRKHLPRVDDYLWVAEDGMKMQGYNGSQCWDTSFAIQAIVESGLAHAFPECSKKVYDYLERTQIRTDEDRREYFFRQVSKGGWPFSTAAHGWPISDCTAEGLKVSVECWQAHSLGEFVPCIPSVLYFFTVTLRNLPISQCLLTHSRWLSYSLHTFLISTSVQSHFRSYVPTQTHPLCKTATWKNTGSSLPAPPGS
jgi:squalene/oxidosqualene cyclase-like protein